MTGNREYNFPEFPHIETTCCLEEDLGPEVGHHGLVVLGAQFFQVLLLQILHELHVAMESLRY